MYYSPKSQEMPQRAVQSKQKQSPFLMPLKTTKMLEPILWPEINQREILNNQDQIIKTFMREEFVPVAQWFI